MKLAKPQKAAIALIVPATIILYMYGFTSGADLDKLIDSMLWNHSFGVPVLIDIIAKIEFASILLLVFYPLARRTYRWIRRD